MPRLPIIAIALAAMTTAAAAQDGIKRTPLQKVNFPEGYTTVTGLAEIQPGVSAGRHTHPGIETGFVLEGETVLSIDGQGDVTMKAGDSYVIPAGVPHDAKAISEKPVKVLGIYVIERGKPLASPAK
nr:cupin domain-containing protein [Mesorhizobium sp.]